MKLGVAEVELMDGVIRNSYETVTLADEFQVMVPSLVKVEEGEIKPMFEMFTETNPEDEQRLRIMARCVGEAACEQLFLVDRDDRNITEYFKPRTGRQLHEYELPNVHMHAFSWVGMMRPSVSALYEESHSEPIVGQIVRKPQ